MTKTIDIKQLQKKVDEVSVEPHAFRTRLGGSELGDDCKRRVFYKFRHMFRDIPEPRMQRLFDRGHREEASFIKLLQKCGAVVHFEDPETKDQYKVTDFEDHFGGSLDAVIEWYNSPWREADPCLGEFKTYNSSRFQTLKKEGVRISAPKYYSQMQLYMGHANLKWALFCAVNKEDDDLYWEIVHFDQQEFDRLQTLAGHIIAARKPLGRISDTPTFWKCKGCKAHAICHKGAAPEKNCRSCQHAYPDTGGKWSCEVKTEFGIVCERYKAIV